MTLSWIYQALLSGTLVTLAAVVLERIARRTGRQTRWIWFGALLMGVGLVALAPGRKVTRRPHDTTLYRASATTPPTPVVDRVDQVAGDSSAPPVPARLAPPAPRVSPTSILSSGSSWLESPLFPDIPASVRTTLIACWLFATLQLAILAFVVHVRIRRRRRKWEPSVLLGRNVLVSVSTGPAVVGVLHPHIVVPRWLLDRTPSEQETVLTHEMEHLAARDPLLIVAAWVAVLALPWHPAVWFIVARLRLAIEVDCDRRTLAGGVSRAEYGSTLIDLAAMNGEWETAIAFSMSPSHLERRLAVIASATGERLALSGWAGIVAATLVLAAACSARIRVASTASFATVEPSWVPLASDGGAPDAGAPNPGWKGHLYYFDASAPSSHRVPISRDSALRLIDSVLVQNLDGVAREIPATGAVAEVTDVGIPVHRLWISQSPDVSRAEVVASRSPQTEFTTDSAMTSEGFDEVMALARRMRLSPNAAIFVDSTRTTLDKARAAAVASGAKYFAIWGGEGLRANQNAMREKRALPGASDALLDGSLHDILAGLGAATAPAEGALWIGTRQPASPPGLRAVPTPPTTGPADVLYFDRSGAAEGCGDPDCTPISRDSAVVLVGESLMHDLDGMATQSKDGAWVTDWAVPSHTVMVLHKGTDFSQADPTESNGLVQDLSQFEGADKTPVALSAKAIDDFMREIHMDPAVQFYIDSTPVTRDGARAALDSKRIFYASAWKQQGLRQNLPKGRPYFLSEFAKDHDPASQSLADILKTLSAATIPKGAVWLSTHRY